MVGGCGGNEKNKNELSKLGLSLLFIIMYYELPWFQISSHFQLFIKTFSTIFNHYRYILTQNINKNCIDYVYLLHVIIIYIVRSLFIFVFHYYYYRFKKKIPIYN